MLQNPHRQPASCATSPTRPGSRADWREKVRPAQPLQTHLREKVRPARPLQPHFREKVRPASVKTPILGCFERAGRTFSRSRPPSDHAGRTFSRTRRNNIATLKPTTPLRAPNQGALKPVSPLLTPNKGLLKPASPLPPKNAPKRPFRARKGDDGFNPTRARASKGDGSFRQPVRLVYRTQMRYPWPAAGPGRATSGRLTLQTSSNQRNSNRLARTPVTNVVNLSPKTTIFTEKADGLTTFVTTRTKAPQKPSTPGPCDTH